MNRKAPSKTSSDKDQQRMYDDLAWTWPIISPPDDYVEEAELFAWAIPLVLLTLTPRSDNGRN